MILNCDAFMVRHDLECCFYYTCKRRLKYWGFRPYMLNMKDTHIHRSDILSKEMLGLPNYLILKKHQPTIPMLRPLQEVHLMKMHIIPTNGYQF